MSCGPPRALQEGAHHVAFAGQHLLGEVEVEARLHEVGHLVDLFGVDQHVVDARRGDADQALRHRPRVQEREPATDLLDVVHDLHLVTGRRLEADRLTLPDLFALADAPHAEPVALDGGLELVEVVLELGLEREAVDADPRVVPDRQAVVVALVPALEEQALLGALDDVEPEHLRVVGGGELEIRRADVDVRQAKDAHAVTVRRSFRILGSCPALRNGQLWSRA